MTRVPRVDAGHGHQVQSLTLRDRVLNSGTKAGTQTHETQDNTCCKKESDLGVKDWGSPAKQGVRSLGGKKETVKRGQKEDMTLSEIRLRLACVSQARAQETVMGIGGWAHFGAGAENITLPLRE